MTDMLESLLYAAVYCLAGIALLVVHRRSLR